jgi:hypothetical protein
MKPQRRSKDWRAIHRANLEVNSTAAPPQGLQALQSRANRMTAALIRDNRDPARGRWDICEVVQRHPHAVPLGRSAH